MGCLELTATWLWEDEDRGESKIEEVGQSMGSGLGRHPVSHLPSLQTS